MQNIHILGGSSPGTSYPKVLFMGHHVICLSCTSGKGKLCVCVCVCVFNIIMGSPTGKGFHHHCLSWSHISRATFHLQHTVRSIGKLVCPFLSINQLRKHKSSQECTEKEVAKQLKQVLSSFLALLDPFMFDPVYFASTQS